jgi:hypothetical protein
LVLGVCVGLVSLFSDCTAASAQCAGEPAGTSCEADLNLCTTDRCDGAGTCVFHGNVTCLAPNPPCAAGEVCIPSIGCAPIPDAPPGTLCEGDGNPCTVDYCDGAGSCVYQFDVACVTGDPPCSGAVCRPATGACEWQECVVVSTLSLEHNPSRFDRWKLVAHWAMSVDPTGELIAVRVTEPGTSGENHVQPLIVNPAQTSSGTVWKYKGSVAGNGTAALVLRQRSDGWRLTVRAKGENILPAFPASPDFQVTVGIGPQMLTSPAAVLRDLSPDLKRSFP